MALIQDRLDVAEETLRALQAGEVDAIVMATGPGEQRIYTLDTEDRPYRRLVERMSEGAALVDADALIVYANQWLATLLAVPLQSLLGHPFTDWLGTEPERSRFIHRLATAASGRHDEYTLHRPGDGSVQVLIGVSVTQESDGLLRCLTVTDLSPQKAQQQAQHRLNTELTARLEAEAALHKVEQRVALLDERQRIAEDLHDLVIQRLFAAGLELEAVRRSGGDGAARIDSAREGIDDAIIELRASIHNLKMGMEPADLAAAVDRVVRQAARTLGFSPTIAYTGAPETVPPAIGAELLAVLNEALSNTARHANASHVDITIAARGHEVELRVTDDGCGITRLERSSGITHMNARAQRLGGIFSWQTNQPTGTIIDWRVPVAGKA
jgi:signal transduction histidine kinase